MSREVMPDDKLLAVMNVIFNVWFRKWRNKTICDDDWDQIIAEADAISDQGRQYPLVNSLLVAFIKELEARALGGIYPDWAKFGKQKGDKR